MDVNVNFVPDPRIDALAESVNEILRILRSIHRTQGAIMADLSELTAAVEENTTVDQSVIQLVNNLADQIEALATDPAALAALAASLRSSSAEVVAAIVANTPAEPTP